MQKQTYTLVADFSVNGNLAYLSHQETLTMFQRAFIRASIPLKFSSGFNPHPRLSISFPRSVGTCSVEDRICTLIECEEMPPLNRVQDTIQQQLPSGCGVHRMQCLPGKCSFSPSSVRYLFQLKTFMSQKLSGHLKHCNNQIQSGEPVEVKRYRPKKKRYNIFDISAYVRSLDYKEDRIEVVCGIGPSGTVRIDELMQWLNIEIQDLRKPVGRTDINWNQH